MQALYDASHGYRIYGRGMHNAGPNAETDAEIGVQPYAELWMQSDMDVELDRCRA